MCVDYKKLNSVIRKDHFPYSLINQILERLVGQSFYCFLYEYSGYNPMPVYHEDQCPSGTFAYRRMPFGLCNAPFTLQRCMMAVFSNYIDNLIDAFVDDFSVFGSSFDELLANLFTVLKRYEAVNLVLS